MPRFEDWKNITKFSKELIEDDFNHENRLILKAKYTNACAQNMSIKFMQKCFALSNEFKWWGAKDGLAYEQVIKQDGNGSFEWLQDIEVSKMKEFNKYSSH